MDHHWSHQVSETTLSFAPDGDGADGYADHLPIGGGSEHGYFCMVGEPIKHNQLIYHSGPASKLYPNDIILEVQGLKVAGYTSSDLKEWVTAAAQNPVLIKTAKAGTLKKELRPYLNFGFPKGSVDHDTQMTIRENLFQRTVPCTTRPPRDGETNGVDYTFVSLEEFRALEKNGNLLESGEYDGNFYGMPKPPVRTKDVKKERSSSDNRPGAHPSSKGKRQRNRSTIEATSNKNHPIDNTVHSAHIPGTDIIMPTPSRGPSRGPVDKSTDRTPQERPHLEAKLAPPSPGHRPPSQPTDHVAGADDLPTNWELAYTPEGHAYFIDHKTETTHWTHPRQAASKPSTPAVSPTQNLPYGWEKVVDPHYGTYYIDHLSRKTQYDAPNDSTTNGQELVSPSLSAKSGRSVPSYREPDSVSQQHIKPFFTKNPSELAGEVFTSLLTKSSRGFGFTIVGGDERDEEFLQIKNVVPNGPADKDGVLRTGDVLVEVNARLVLGFTHSDVVSTFQSIKPGDQVDLKVCRGYPLAFDPNDPNTEIVTTIAVSMPKITAAEAKQREVERATKSQKDVDDTASLDEFADSLLRDLPVNDEAHLPRQSSEFPTAGQMFSIEIVRGQSGFGFTIADSVHGQKVKHILDPGRCKTLQEGDILVRIAGRDVRDIDHLDVVDVLKSCPQGQPTEIVVQRGGFKKVPRPPSQSRTHEESNDPSPFSSPDLDRLRGMKFISGSDSADLASSDDQDAAAARTASPVIIRPTATSSRSGMFKWSVNGSTGQLPRSNLQSTSSLVNRDDDSEGLHTPPPLPTKVRLNSDTTADSKENLLQSSLTEAPSSMILPSQLRNSSNLLNNNNPQDESKPRSSSILSSSGPSPGLLPSKQSLGQHPVMNQYNQYQPPKESFYDVPNKFRNDNGRLSAKQRFDMMADPTRTDSQRHHSETNGRSHPQALPSHPSVTSSHAQSPLQHRRSRTPGPEHMRTPPDRSIDDSRFRSKTPNPADHRSRGSYSIQNDLNQPPSANPGATSFENSTPVPSQPNQFSPPPGWKEQWQTLDVSLKRGDKGFGFRIVGGPEEGTQVAIGHIVPGGVADLDRRLRTGDEIVRVDDRSTLEESHHIVVALMGQASSAGHVNIGVRRRVLVQDTSVDNTPLLHNPPNDRQQPYDVIVTRREDEGFGFIIVSSVNRVGAVVGEFCIGRIIDNSPAERCGRLRVGDRILAVNDVDISRMLHEDIVNLIKDSGFSVKLAVAAPVPLGSDKKHNDFDQDFDQLGIFNRNDPLRGSLTNATALPSMGDNETLVRNMHSHTTLSTADRYNGLPPPLQNSKSAGNLSGLRPSQSFGSRSDSRLPSTSSNPAPPYEFSQTGHQPPRPASSMEPSRNPAYNTSQSRHSHDSASPRQAYEQPIPTHNPPQPGYNPSRTGYEPPRTAYEPPRTGYEPQRTGYEQPRSGHEPPRSSYEPQRPAYNPAKIGVKTPLVASAVRPTGSSQMSSAPNQQNSQPSPGSILSIELTRSSRGFGFSIRGGRQFNNMPLYVLRIAEEGAAHLDQRLQVGDEILEINDQPTGGMSHAEAINLIQSGGSKVKLLVRRTGQLPNIVSEQGLPSPQGSGLSSPAIRNAATSGPPPPTNQHQPQSMGYEPNQNHSKDRYGPPMRQDSQKDQFDGNKYNPPAPAGYRPEMARTADMSRGGPGIGRGVSLNRGPDTNRPGYQSDRYTPAPVSGSSRYPEPAAAQQRGYPVGRDRDSAMSSDRLMSSSHPPPPSSHQSSTSRPYNSSTVGQPGQYNGPGMSSSFQPPPSQPQYSNSQPYQPPAPYSSNNTGPAYRPPQPGGGSYNAGAMNRQMNQQMYNYYDGSAPPSQSERQPPIGQNSYDSRAPAPQSNYPGSSSYNARYGGPPTYKAMDYGPQGIIRNNSAAMSSNQQGMYGGRPSMNSSGQMRPSQQSSHENYNEQPPVIANNYYSRQAAYQ